MIEKIQVKNSAYKKALKQKPAMPPQVPEDKKNLTKDKKT